MKKMLCCLLALLLLCGAALASDMRTGEDGYLRFGAALYCVEANGIFKLEGVYRSQICPDALELDAFGGLISDGAVACALGADGAIMRVDLNSGEAGVAAQCGGSLTAEVLVGAVGDAYFVLGDAGDSEAYALFLVRGEDAVRIADGVRSAFQWGDQIVIEGASNEAGFGWLCSVAADGTVTAISERAYAAAASGGLLYYWEAVPAEEDASRVASASLNRFDGSETVSIAQTGSENFHILPFFDGFGAVILPDMGNACAIVELANARFTRVEPAARDLSEWQTGTAWFFDRGNGHVYSYGGASQMLCIEWDGEDWQTCAAADMSWLADDALSTVVDIYDGVLFCRDSRDAEHLYWSQEI